MAAEDGGLSWNPDGQVDDAPPAEPAGLARPRAGEARPGRRHSDRLRDTAVLVIGLLTAINLLQYKFTESNWSRDFALFNSILLFFLTSFMLIGLLMFLPGLPRLFSTRPRKLVISVLGILLSSVSIGGLLAMRQGSIYGLTLGLLALAGLSLLIAGQFEVGWKDAAGIFMGIFGMALITLVPVHEAFGIFSLGDLWAAPNLAMMAVGAVLASAGILMVHGAGEPGGRPLASYGLWLVGIMALFLVPFHEAAGINSNQVYGLMDQTLMVTGAAAVMAGVSLFLRKWWRDTEFERHLREGDECYAGGDSAKALERYEMALSLEPDSAEAWARRGSALERQGRKDEARKSLERALQLEPENLLALLTYSAAQRRAGKPESALKLATLATEARPMSEAAWLNRANALADLKRGDEALEAFESALRLDSAYDKAWYNKGVLLLSLGRTSEALECFDKVLGSRPGDEGALVMRKRCFAALGTAMAEG